MTFLQRLRPSCDDHDDCHAIECVTDTDIVDDETGAVVHPAGSIVWVSHAPDHTHPECRVNPDHPAEDITSRDMCDDCTAHFDPATSAPTVRGTS